MAVTVSPKVDAQLSKWMSAFLTSVPYCRYFCMVYISTMLLEIGVPVAKTTPRPPVSSSRYLHFIYRSLDFIASVWLMPPTLRIFVYAARFL